jgi:hypothetical protein
MCFKVRIEDMSILVNACYYRLWENLLVKTQRAKRFLASPSHPPVKRTGEYARKLALNGNFINRKMKAILRAWK